MRNFLHKMTVSVQKWNWLPFEALSVHLCRDHLAGSNDHLTERDPQTLRAQVDEILELFFGCPHGASFFFPTMFLF